jgi:valyl-tRNA synthetase
MPYVSEDLWQRLPRPASRRTSIAFGPYPQAETDGRKDDAVLRDMEIFKAVVSAARTIRSEHDIEPKADVPLSIRTDNDAARALLDARLGALSFLAGAKAPILERTGGPRAPGTTVNVVPSVHGPIEVLVGLRGLVDKTKELARIDREKKKLEKDIGVTEKKLSSPAFVEKAPKDVVDEAKALLQQLKDALARLEESKKLAEEL